MNMGDLRSFFMSEDRRQADLEEHALRVREKNFIDELNMMKIEKDKTA